MINSSAIVPSLQIADEFVAKGLTICAVDNQTFGDLVSKLHSVDENASDAAAELMRISKPVNDNVDIYNYKRDALADQMAKLLENTANFCINTINPIIREILEGAEEIKSQREQLGLSASINIVPLTIHPILNTETLGMLLDTVTKNVNGVTKLTETLYSKLWETASVEDIVKTMQTGSEQFNIELLNLIASKYTGLTVKNIDIYGSNSLSRGAIDSFMKNDDVLCYLFFRGVYSDNHPTVKFSALSTHEKQLIKSHVDFWGNQVNARIETANSLQKSGNVINMGDATKNTIYVYKQAYTRWLEEGGCSECLIGYWISTGKRATGLDAAHALASKDSYIERFNGYVRIEMQKVSSTVNTELERYITKALITKIEEHVSETEECAQMKARANKFYQTMKISNFASIDDFCKFMVCKTIGKDSDAFGILNTITDYGRQHPDASFDDAVLEAMTVRLVDWLADNMCVIENKTIDISKVMR